MYQRTMGDVANPTDPPVMIPGFTPATDVIQQNSPGIDWTEIIDTGLSIIPQVVHPGYTYPTTFPTYTPTSTALLGLGSNVMPLLLLGGAALLLMRKH